MSLADWIFPPRCLSCRDFLRGAARRRTFCGRCEGEFPWANRGERSGSVWPGEGPLKRVWGAGRYEGVLAQLIHRIKYGREERVGRRLVPWLGRSGAAGSLKAPDDVVVIPVPLHPSRLRERGFNQAWVLSRSLKKAGLVGPVAFLEPSALRRIRPTPPQTGLTRSERLANLRGAFEVVQPERVDGRPVLLVDDVTTTGATLTECSRALKKAGAVLVEGWVLAKAG